MFVEFFLTFQLWEIFYALIAASKQIAAKFSGYAISREATKSHTFTLRCSCQQTRYTSSVVTRAQAFKNSNYKKNVITASSLAQHEKDTGHHINWADFQVVWGDNHPYRLLIKESLLIQPRSKKTASETVLTDHETVKTVMITRRNPSSLIT